MTTKTNPALNATNLKAALWETLQDLKSGAVQPGQGDAIAAQASRCGSGCCSSWR